MAVLAHDQIVAGPIGGSNLSLAKGLVSERARLVLGSADQPLSLAKICDCHRLLPIGDVKMEDASGTPSEAEPDDETVEGFAALARDQLDVTNAKALLPDELREEVDGVEDVNMEVDPKLG
jgi:endoribonuclease Dicer